MRIGILTLTDNTNGYNYGATFQCLALQRTLERLNNEVLVFNFKSDDNGNFCYKTINYLKNNSKIDKWTYNKSLQKAIESYRITKDQKELLKNMKKY